MLGSWSNITVPSRLETLMALRWLPAVRPKTTALLMTCLLLLLSDSPLAIFNTLTITLCVLMLAVRSWLHSPLPWSILLTLSGIHLWRDRLTADNHVYLIFYWLLVVVLALALPRFKQTMQRNARLLIACCFLFATGAKFASADFRSGAFFEYTLVSDSRFFPFVNAATGASYGELGDAATTVEWVRDSSNKEAETIEIDQIGTISVLAMLMTGWTVLIEGAVALLFLFLPDNKWVYRGRNLTLLLFMVTTYAVAPVVNFGRILSILGCAQCHEKDRLFPLLFVGSFCLIQLFSAFYG